MSVLAVPQCSDLQDGSNHCFSHLGLSVLQWEAPEQCCAWVMWLTQGQLLLSEFTLLPESRVLGFSLSGVSITFPQGLQVSQGLCLQWQQPGLSSPIC